MDFYENHDIVTSYLLDDKVERKSNKIKCIIFIIFVSLIIIAMAITLLVCHFKYHLFEDKIYKLDVKISRKKYQANYFKETRNITANYVFSKGIKEDVEIIIKNNFMVLITDRNQINKDDYINTAYLVILNSTVKINGTEEKLTSFNIFDSNVLKELELYPNLNSTKYPMAIFSFYENGTLIDIQLPDNMDKFNFNIICELIENVIPKLSRNRTEDISNGLNIKNIKNKKSNTLVESYMPKSYLSFEGSKHSKIVERKIEDEQIMNIKVNNSAFFQTIKENENDDDLGIKSLYANSASEIKAIKNTEEIENVAIIQNISKKYNFISKEHLREKISLQENQEYEQIMDKEGRNNLVFVSDERWSQRIGYNIENEKIYDLHTAHFLGQKLEFKYRVGVRKGKAISEIIVVSNLGTATFGDDGISFTLHKQFNGKKSVFKFEPESFPFITVEAFIGGTVDILVEFTTVEKWQLQIVLTGTLDVSCENTIGKKGFVAVSAGVGGTCLKAQASVLVDREITGIGLHFWGGEVNGFVLFSTFLKDWKINFNLIKAWQFR